MNYAFRAAVVPAGEHTVEMAFVLPSVQSARSVAMAGSGVLVLLILGGFGMALTGRGGVED